MNFKFVLVKMILFLHIVGCTAPHQNDVGLEQSARLALEKNKVIPAITPSQTLSIDTYPSDIPSSNNSETQVSVPVIIPTTNNVTLTTTIISEKTSTLTPIAPLEEILIDEFESPTSEHGARVGFIYIFPIQPPDLAKYNPEHHDYPATDIFAPERSMFVAVTDGVIEELSDVDLWDPATNDPALRGGRFVSLIGVDGVRYYGSHLDEVASEIEVGKRVNAGALLGYVGNSGNARGIIPHLHFGISHPTFIGDWKVRRGEVPPFKYLQAWERGENLTPELSSAVN